MKKQKREDGRYSSQIYLGKKDKLDKAGNPVLDDEGNPVQVRNYHTVYATSPKELSEKVVHAKMQMGKGIDITAANDTFGTWCELLIQDKQVAGVSNKQIENLHSYKNHLKQLRQIPIIKITASQLQVALNGLSEWRNGKRPLAKTTIRKVNNFAKQVFAKAVGARITEYNPANYVTVARGESSTKRVPIEDYQKRWIEDTEHKAQTAAMIMLYGGLRRGEALALTWADVNLESAVITVNKAVEFTGNSPTIKGTKTAAGTREVSIPQILVNHLRLVKSDYIYVVHDNGCMYTNSKWDSLWRSYMVDLDVIYGYNNEVHKFSPKRSGFRIKTFTPHQLRHTYATMLYLAGVDVMEAKYQLGHSDIKVTLGIYTHFEKKYKRTSMNKLDEYLSKSSASQVSEKETI